MGVEALGVGAEDFGSPHRHGAVDKYRYVGQLAGAEELMQEIAARLRTANAERGDQYLAPAFRGSADYLAQALSRLLDRFMDMATVGTLAEHQVAGRDRRGVAQNRQSRPAQVAGKSQPPH